MKKIIIFGILALVLLALLASCSRNSGGDSNTDTSSPNNTPNNDISIPELDNSGNNGDNNAHDGEPPGRYSVFTDYIIRGYEIETSLGARIALVHPDLVWDEADSEGFTAKFDEDGRLIVTTIGFNVFHEVEGMTSAEIDDLITAIRRAFL